MTKQNNNCDHSSSYVVSRLCEDDYGNIFYETDVVNMDVFEDVDLHRYKCTLCDEIFYYSSAAGDYYMRGVKSDIIGLDR